MAIKLSPEDTDGYFFRAQVLEAIGQILPALNDYCRIIQLQPDNYKAYIKRGIICETLNKDALAL
jgi:tetratricopeptide (TPR) repeat protein